MSTTSIKELLPEIRERREEIEEARRLPADLAERLRATGIYALGIPKAVGGEEVPQTDLMQVIETVAAADGSTGWCAMLGIANNIAAGYMNERGAKEVYADPTEPSAGIAAPIGAAVEVDGGMRVSGRWPFASGITHSEWIWVGCLVMEDGAPVMTDHGPRIVHVSMPSSEMQVHDTWHVSGLRGTGSHDVSCEDVFVPGDRVWSLFDPSGHRPEPLYQLPVVSGFVSLLASVSLGIARGALDELTELAQTKMPSLSEVVLADKVSAQIQIARAEAALGGARTFLYATVEDMWQTLSAGRTTTPVQNARTRAAALQAAETGAAVAATVNTLGGGTSIYSSSSLQRHARDAEAVTHHFTVSQHTWEETGRVLLGREPTMPVF